MHKDSYLAHVASVAAAEQGKFWPYHDKVFASQPKIQKDNLVTIARDLGLDMPRFQAALDSASGKPAIDADLSEGRTLGLTGTPSFFVNGKFASGAKPFEEFAQMINAELKRLNLPIPSGARTAGG